MASGYSELGMFEEAVHILNEIPSRDYFRAEIIGLRLHMFMRLERWREAEIISEYLVEKEPMFAAWWLALAVCKNILQPSGDAEKVLWRALKLHGRCGPIRYELARYAKMANRLPEARILLFQAVLLNEGFREAAKKDSQLASLVSSLDESVGHIVESAYKRAFRANDFGT